MPAPASAPVPSVSLKSINTMSGLSSVARETASLTEPACPITIMSFWSLIRAASPSATTWWSSTMRTRARVFELTQLRILLGGLRFKAPGRLIHTGTERTPGVALARELQLAASEELLTHKTRDRAANTPAPEDVVLVGWLRGRRITERAGDWSS